MSNVPGTCCLMPLYCRISGVEASDMEKSNTDAETQRRGEHDQNAFLCASASLRQVLLPLSRVDPAELDGTHDPVDSQHIRRDAIVHLVRLCVFHDGVE